MSNTYNKSIRIAAKKDGKDSHIQRGLNNDHVAAPDFITQKQLDRDRVPEKHTTIEDQLNSKRLAETDFSITEIKLNNSKSKLVKHRNAEAYTGDINKLEEQRLGKDPVEKEKAKLSSKVNPDKKWWEHLKVDASSLKKVVTAQLADEELSFDEESRWGRGQAAWGEDDDNSDSLIPLDEIAIDDVGAVDTEDIENISLDKIVPVDSPIGKGLYVSFNINNPAAKESAIKVDAYNKTILAGYDYLENIDDFSPASFTVKGEKVFARLFGDEYYPSATTSTTPKNVDGPTFVVSEVEETDIPDVVIGTVRVNPSEIELVSDMDNDELKTNVINILEDYQDDLYVADDGFDFSELSQGIIKFVGNVSRQEPAFDESEFSPESELIEASTNFDVIVIGKKK
jgi:hypothetical protein